MNGRAAYTNVINTARLRETLKKEAKVEADRARGQTLAELAMHNIASRRRKTVGGDKIAALDELVASRNYKPTSSVSIGGYSHHVDAVAVIALCIVILQKLCSRSSVLIYGYVI